MPTVWTRLTPADLLTRFSARELEAVRRACAAFDDAAAQDILDQTADTARGYVAAHPANRLSSAPHTVPPALRATCLDIAVVDLSQSVAGALADPSGLRAKAHERAIRRLEAVADGRFAVEQPGPGESEASPSASPTPPSFYEKPTLLSRRAQRGSY